MTDVLELRAAEKLMRCCGFPAAIHCRGPYLMYDCGRCGADRVVGILQARRALQLGILDPAKEADARAELEFWPIDARAKPDGGSEVVYHRRDRAKNLILTCKSCGGHDFVNTDSPRKLRRLCAKCGRETDWEWRPCPATS